MRFLKFLIPNKTKNLADHYLDVPLDLSKVLFVATVNRIAPLAPALKDRLEVLEVSSYTHQDKEQIAQHHLIPRQRSNHGLNDNDFELLEGSLARLIDHYTREAGVRQLDRELASICREAAIARVNETGPLRIKPDDLNDLLGPRKYHSELPEPHALPGLALGLAWTQVGGEILHVEVTDMAGTGKLKLTGQLGDVMKESGEAALSYLRSHAIPLGLSEDAQENLLEKRDLHIHFPAGATPKDGPLCGSCNVLSHFVVAPKHPLAFRSCHDRRDFLAWEGSPRWEESERRFSLRTELVCPECCFHAETRKILVKFLRLYSRN